MVNILKIVEDSIGDKPISNISMDISVFDILHSEVLTKIYDIMLKANLHGIAFTFPQSENEAVEDIASYTFSPKTRSKNLWWHLDAFDRSESVSQIMTWLYSWTWSYSQVPTYTTLTTEVDLRAMELLEWRLVKWVYRKELDEYREKAWIYLPKGSSSLGYYTLLQNCFLAHRDINSNTQNSLLDLRDKLTKSILLDNSNTIGAFTTSNDTSSLLLFRNGLSENRDIAHTRFDISDKPWYSQWNVQNLWIHAGWNIHSNNTPKFVLAEGVKVVAGKITNRDRGSIIPK